MCSADGFQPDLEAGEESSEICGGRHLNVSSQRLQGPVARKCQTLENHSEEAGEDVANLVLADLPDGGHAQAAVKVDVQLHPGERLQRLKSFSGSKFCQLITLGAFVLLGPRNLGSG